MPLPTEPVAGDYCTSSSVCGAYITSAVCSAGTCQCPTDHWQFSSTECRPGVALGGACTVLSDCQVSLSSRPQPGPSTECRPGVALGGACTVLSDCQVGPSEQPSPARPQHRVPARGGAGRSLYRPQRLSGRSEQPSPARPQHRVPAWRQGRRKRGKEGRLPPKRKVGGANI